MRRYGLLLLVLVLAVTSLLAAAAYNTATVTNAATLKITSTDDSLLALSPKTVANTYGWNSPYYGVGNKDWTCFINQGELEFDFANGSGGYSTPGGTDQHHGVQPNSVYIWDYLFMIRNKTSEKLSISIATTFAGLPADLHVWMKGDNSALTGSWVQVSAGNQVVMNPVQPRQDGSTDECYVSVKIVCDPTYTGPFPASFSGNVVVTATAIP